MPGKNFITLTDADGTTAVVAPELGAWLLRYARRVAPHGLVEALHCSPAVIDRYPREMYAGIPVLFPLVGKNIAGGREHHYEWNGRLLEMPQHGFARRCKWAVTEQTPTAVAMELTESPATQAHYPFAFRQRLRYHLAQGRLHWEQVIENRSPGPLPFSTGFHPYLAVPLTGRSRRDTCFVEVPDARRAAPRGNWERHTTKPFPAQNWSVQEEVATALFLTDLKKRELVLVDPVSELEVALNFEDAPLHRFVALWARSTSEPFYCVEPWTALPNSFTRLRDHELILLEPQRTFRAAMWMELRSMA